MKIMRDRSKGLELVPQPVALPQTHGRRYFSICKYES